MKILYTVRLAGIILIGCLLLAGGAAASGSIQAYIGDTIPLQGYSYGSSTIWLFLTGPNLPVHGVALDNIYARADEGHFTRVNVDSNDHWVYKWDTNSIGGRLDTGTYTVWVVNGPNDLSHLSGVDYSTIAVSLGLPGIALTTPMIPGTMVLSSFPNETSLVINNEYKGKTPLTLVGLEPGTYNVTFSRFGYHKFFTLVKVGSGSVSEVTASLEPETGGLAISTSPAGARVTLDGADAGISPVTIPNIPAGNHTLNVSTAGYTPQEQPVNVVANQTRAVNLVLKPVSPISEKQAAGLVPATLLSGVTAVLLAAVYRSRRH
ncbi:MAG: PEGA domain-containing protein [Methanoregula sp.]|nr:PEGA domain-containing protein [Methanoregula sp.]